MHNIVFILMALSAIVTAAGCALSSLVHGQALIALVFGFGAFALYAICF